MCHDIFTLTMVVTCKKVAKPTPTPAKRLRRSHAAAIISRSPIGKDDEYMNDESDDEAASSTLASMLEKDKRIDDDKRRIHELNVELEQAKAKVNELCKTCVHDMDPKSIDSGNSAVSQKTVNTVSKIVNTILVSKIGALETQVAHQRKEISSLHESKKERDPTKEELESIEASVKSTLASFIDGTLSQEQVLEYLDVDSLLRGLSLEAQ